jgi:REP element-mobilizing transposase RayT
MTYARKTLVSLQDTPYYHVVARCVRRAWLCGIDEYAGRDHSHRKQWVIDRLAHLAAVFAIDVCAYAIMSNHYHLVLRIDRDRAQKLTKREVALRWSRIFTLPELVRKWLDAQEGGTNPESEAEAHEAETLIEKWRIRLFDLSWFMKCLNEHLARKANAEDECDGRFWQGRFRCQALLDESGLLTAMAYVDLNPVRAGVAISPERSSFTSIYERIREWRAAGRGARSKKGAERKVPLQPFLSTREARPQIPFKFEDYLELVDWSGRVIRDDKGHAMDAQLPPVMRRLNIDRDAWGRAMRPKGNVFGRALGRLNHLRLHAQTLGQSWVRGLREAERLYA